MKPLAEQNYYELLEVGPAARPEEIEAAFNRAIAFYGPDSVATYSLVSPEEAKALAQRLEDAYLTLSDAAARRAYDLAQGLAQPEPEPPPVPASPSRPSSLWIGASALDEDDEGPAAPGPPPGARPVVAIASQLLSQVPAPEPEPPRPPEPALEAAPEPVLERPVEATEPGRTGGASPLAVPASQAPRPESASAPIAAPEPAARTPEPEAALPPAEATPPQAEATSPQAEATPPQAEAAPPQAEAAPPEPEPEVALPVAVASAAALEVPALPSAFGPPASPPAAAQPSPGPEPANEPAPRPEEPRPDPEPVLATEPIDPLPTPVAIVRAPVPRREPLPPQPTPLPASPGGGSKPPSKAFEIPPDAVFSGELLRRIRESRGLGLREVSERTRIGSVHLENIEADHYKALPVTVYLRGFLMSLARELKLDPLKVSKSYLDLVARAKQKS